MASYIARRKFLARGGRVAARGACATGRKEIHDRYSQCRWRWRPSRAGFSFFRWLAGVGMGRRGKRCFREPQRGESARTAARTCSGPGPTQGRCHCGIRNSRAVSGQAGHQDHSDRHDSCGRPVGERARCQSGATRRQRYGDESHGAGPGCEATRIVERGSAPLLSRGRALECGQSLFRARIQRDAGWGADIGG